MKKIHDTLMQHFGWYAQWHNNPTHHHLHFVTLVLVAAAIGISLYTDIKIYAQDIDLEYSITTSQNHGLVGHSLNELNTKAVRSLQGYTNASDSEKSIHIQNLKTILRDRKQKIVTEFIKGNSNDNFFFPEDFKGRFPEEVQDLLETDINISGTLSVLFSDGIEEKDSKITHTLVSSSKKEYILHFGKNMPHARTGDKVSVKGKAFGTEVLLSDGGSNANFQVTTSELASDVLGTKTLLVILVSFQNNTAQPWTQASVTNSIFNNPDSTNALIKEGSYNKVTLTGTVTPWYTIGSSIGTSCDSATWASQAEQMAIAGGYDPSSYNHVMFLLNGVSPSICNWGGQAYIGGRQSWVNGIYAAHGTKAHELGHNFGSYHSGFLSCGSTQIAPIATCAFNNYGEYNAKMGGGGNFQFNSVSRGLFAWIPPSQVATVTSKGNYTIASDYSSDSVTPKILKIAKPDTGENYYITYKQAIGFNVSLGAGATRGASVYLKPNMYYMGNTSGGPSDSILLPMQTGSDYANAALWDGGTFTDPANGITITQISHTADTVTVSVDYPVPVCIPANPTINISPASAYGISGKSVGYTVTVKNNNSSACAPTTYTLSNTSLPANWLFTGGTVGVNSGSSASKQIIITSDVLAVDGSYTFNVVATDTINAGKVGSAIATYIVYNDQVGPSITITSPKSDAVLAANTTFSATVSDISGVSKVEFYSDNVILKTLTSAPYTFKWNTRKITKGSHILLVKAYDALGNMSQSSTTVSK